MIEIYRRNQGTFEEQTKKVRQRQRWILRVDYLAPGRGKSFIATAEVIRMGRKGCTTRMMLVNDEGKGDCPRHCQLRFLKNPPCCGFFMMFLGWVLMPWCLCGIGLFWR